MITEVEEEVSTEKQSRPKQYVWEAIWSVVEADQPVRRGQLVSAAEIGRATSKAKKYQKDAQFDGELVGINRREDIIL